MQKRKKMTGGRLIIGLVCAVGLLPLTAHAQNAAYNQTTLVALCQISAAGAAGRFDTAEQLFNEGKDAGLSELQMYEAVLNLLPYIGYPRTLSTLIRFQQVYPDYISQRSQGQSPQPTEPWPEYAPTIWGERGMQIQERADRRQRGEPKAYQSAQSDQSRTGRMGAL